VFNAGKWVGAQKKEEGKTMSNLRNCLGVVAAMAVFASSASADMTVRAVFQDLDASYDAQTGRMSILRAPDSEVNVDILDDAYMSVDDANIVAGGFDLSFIFDIVNPTGLDNMSAAGRFLATDNAADLNNPQFDADYRNAFFGADLDGFIYNPATRTLIMQGVLSTTSSRDRILAGPNGDWSWDGDSSEAPGFDGTGNRVAIEDRFRDAYDTGTLFLVEIPLAVYADLTPILATNADELFADANLHGGFMSDGGVDVTVTVIPAPGAALLGVAGMGFVGWGRRRFS
jgi:hypothetical protein